MCNLREIRDAAGYTQAQLAAALGVSVNTIANWERSRNSVLWFERVAVICALLDCTAQDLIKYVPVDEAGENGG